MINEVLGAGKVVVLDGCCSCTCCCTGSNSCYAGSSDGHNWVNKDYPPRLFESIY